MALGRWLLAHDLEVPAEVYPLAEMSFAPSRQDVLALVDDYVVTVLAPLIEPSPGEAPGTDAPEADLNRADAADADAADADDAPEDALDSDTDRDTDGDTDDDTGEDPDDEASQPPRRADAANVAPALDRTASEMTVDPRVRSEASRRMWTLRAALAPMGIHVSVRGLRSGDGGEIANLLGTSRARIVGMLDILRMEWAALGTELCAAVLCDFARTASGGQGG